MAYKVRFLSVGVDGSVECYHHIYTSGKFARLGAYFRLRELAEQMKRGDLEEVSARIIDVGGIEEDEEA